MVYVIGKTDPTNAGEGEKVSVPFRSTTIVPASEPNASKTETGFGPGVFGVLLLPVC